MRLPVVAALLALVCAAAQAHAQATPAAPAPAAAPTPPPPPAPYGMPIGYDTASKALNAALAEGRKNGWKLAIAVVEPSGELVAFAKDEGAGYGATDVAIGKARSSARFGRETRVLAESFNNGRLWPLAIDGLIPVEGGVPIVIGGRTVGAIGVSGASAAQDGQAAKAGAAAVAG